MDSYARRHRDRCDKEKMKAVGEDREPLDRDKPYRAGQRNSSLRDSDKQGDKLVTLQTNYGSIVFVSSTGVASSRSTSTTDRDEEEEWAPLLEEEGEEWMMHVARSC
jgi:hypothetical protein